MRPSAQSGSFIILWNYESGCQIGKRNAESLGYLEFPQNAIKTRMTFPKVPICLIFEKS